MGYACPVCDTPQVDAKHLADHLALTALLGDDDHESWLDANAPGWEREDDTGLAERVVEEAPEVDVPGRDSAGYDHTGETRAGAGTERAHDPGVAFDGVTEGITADPNPSLDGDAQAALEEAYEITRARREGTRAEDADTDDADETE